MMYKDVCPRRHQYLRRAVSWGGMKHPASIDSGGVGELRAAKRQEVQLQTNRTSCHVFFRLRSTETTTYDKNHGHTCK